MIIRNYYQIRISNTKEISFKMILPYQISIVKFYSRMDARLNKLQYITNKYGNRFCVSIKSYLH